jgi:cellulose synthase operon protein C
MISSPRTAFARRVAAAMVCALASLQAVQAADPKASRYYEDALSRFHEQDMGGAIIQLRNALKIDNRMLPVHVLLGKALLADGQVAAAEVALEEALRLGADRSVVVVPLARAVLGQARPDALLQDERFAHDDLPDGPRAELLVLKAGALGDLGQTRQALALVELARAVDPKRAESWQAEVPIRIRARQFKEAVAAADEAVRLAPGEADVLYLRGSVTHAMGDASGALVWYDKALAADPDHAATLIARAGLRVDGRQDDLALQDLDRLAKADPKDPRAAYLRALLLERRGDAAGVKKALNDVVALVDPVPMNFMRYRPQLLMLGGLAHHGLGEFEKALPYLEAVQRQQSGSPASKLLAQIQLRMGNLDRAIDALEGYLRAFPGDTQAVYLLASAHLAQGRHARAADLMKNALPNGDTPAMRGVLGLSLLAGGHFNDAVAELERAVASDPRQLQAGSALVGIYIQSGQTARAVATAERLAKAHPDRAGVLSLLGSAQLAAGRNPAARAAFEAALKRDPKFLEPQVRLASMDVAARKLQSATARLNAVLAADPANIDALMMLAGALRQQGRLDDAQRWLEKADDVAGPDNINPGMALVQYHLAQGQPARAKEALDRVVSRQPEALPVLALSARVSLANEDDAGARSTLTRASALAGSLAPRLVQIAQLQLEAGDLPGAAHSLGKVLADRPDFLPAQALMTDIDIRRGDWAQADKRARQIVTDFPKLPLGQALTGDLAMARGRFTAALEAYRKMHRIAPSSGSFQRLYRAQAQLNPKAAGTLAAQWLQKHPADLAIHRLNADALARRGEFAQARKAYEALLKQSPADAEALNNLANVLLLLKDPAAAAVANRALAAAPDRPHVIGTAGWAAFQAGQTDRALQLLRDARLRDPDNGETRYFLATVLASRGRQAEARQELETALAGDRPFPSSESARKLLQTLN